MPKVQSRVRYVDHIEGSGKEFFQLACHHDLEGIVGKWKFGTYRADGRETSWIKVKNPTYSQAEGRAELFEKRNGAMRRRGSPASGSRIEAGVSSRGSAGTKDQRPGTRPK